jgi:hypothetical protein
MLVSANGLGNSGQSSLKTIDHRFFMQKMPPLHGGGVFISKLFDHSIFKLLEA